MSAEDGKRALPVVTKIAEKIAEGRESGKEVRDAFTVTIDYREPPTKPQATQIMALLDAMGFRDCELLMTGMVLNRWDEFWARNTQITQIACITDEEPFDAKSESADAVRQKIAQRISAETPIRVLADIVTEVVTDVRRSIRYD